LKVETLFWRFWEGGGADWVDVFEVDNVVEVEAEWEADRAGDEGSEFVCGVTEGEEGGFWKSLRMSTLVGLGVGEGAGTSGFEVDDSDLDNEGATGFVAVGEIIVGGGGFELELDCFRDDGPAC
jgi:hypothetical protein